MGVPQIQVFNSEDFGEVRTLLIDNKPYFVGKDVAEILGYQDYRKALKRHVEKDDGAKRPVIDNIGRYQETIMINESGVLSLVLSSKLPEARKFKHWITSEVIPSIMRKGYYAIDNLIGNRDFLVALAKELVDTNNENISLKASFNEQLPKIQFYNNIADSSDLYSMRDTAVMLNFEGLGRTNLFKFLKEKGLLDNRGIPYQEFVDRKYFSVKLSEYKKNQRTFSSQVVYVTTKGLEYLDSYISNLKTHKKRKEILNIGS